MDKQDARWLAFGWILGAFFGFCIATLLLTAPGNAEVVMARVAPDNIQAAMQKMGPYYDYEIYKNVLRVDTGNGELKRLRY